MILQRIPPLVRWSGGVLALVIALVLLAGSYLGYFSTDPVTVVWPQQRVGNAKAIFLSGDLGFNVGMGPEIADALTNAGLPVIGFNSLTYFRTRRTPREIEGIVRALIERANDEFGPGPTVLIGQSFGADALQLGLAGFGKPDRALVDFVVLVVPTDSVYLSASPNEMLNFSPPDLPAADTANSIDWVPLLCIAGEGEAHSLCPLLHNPNVTTVALPGGHFLDHDASRVVAVILRGIDGLEFP